MPLGVPQARPADAVQQGDDLWYRPGTRYKPDGQTYTASLLVCEDCWEPMPNYVQAPQGFVSPESNQKLKMGTVEGFAAVAAPAKVVCLECYKAAFLRTHVAGSEVPASLSGELRE